MEAVPEFLLPADDQYRLLLYGAGGHAHVILDMARAGHTHIAMVVDDDPSDSTIEGIPLVHSARIDMASLQPLQYLVAIGANSKRYEIFTRLAQFGMAFNIVHPFSSVSPRARLGKGIAIMPGAVVNTGALIGDNVIVNSSASVDHDCHVGSHSHLCPGVHLAGDVKVGTGSFLGTGSSVTPGISIGKNCIIGAGSVVVRDIPDNSLAFGVPARVVRNLCP